MNRLDLQSRAVGLYVLGAKGTLEGGHVGGAIGQSARGSAPPTGTKQKDGGPMAEQRLTVADDMVVSLDYTLRLDDGEIIDSSAGREPLQFLQGQGRIVPGLEEALYGMAVGDEKDVVVSPADGYGLRRPDASQALPRDAFPPDLKLEPGMGIRMRTPSGRIAVAYVAEVRADDVELDFNHPLAGETLYFRAKIAGLRPATEEELAPGCATCAGCSSGECGA